MNLMVVLTSEMTTATDRHHVENIDPCTVAICGQATVEATMLGRKVTFRPHIVGPPLA